MDYGTGWDWPCGDCFEGCKVFEGPAANGCYWNDAVWQSECGIFLSSTPNHVYKSEVFKVDFTTEKVVDVTFYVPPGYSFCVAP